MSARNNYQDTTKYPKKITAADMDPAIVVPPAIPECPAAGANDVAYNLKVDADGFVEWEADQASTPLNLPAAPAAAVSAKDYKLHIATDGTATWVEITG